MKDGVLLINKPQNFTSFDVVAKLRGILKERKIGHGGTLDPNVTGVLPIFVGRATKAIDIAPCTDKKYIATFRLGIKTDTQDIWGAVLEEKTPERDVQKIKDAVLSFKGEQEQIPPMYSAVKVNGVRLYDLAREGVEVERKSRKITVYDISFEGKTENEDEYKFSVHVSKGAYVRTICADIGDRLGCGACMTSLTRTSALGFDISRCVTLDEVQKAADEGRAHSLILDIDEIFSEYPPIILNEHTTRLYKNGVALSINQVSGAVCDAEAHFRVYGCDKKFIGIAKVFYPQNVFKSVKMFYND